MTKEKSIAGGEVELLAKWMIHHGFTTGHGDTIEGLLNELSWQIADMKTTGEDTDVYLTEDEWEDMVRQQECLQAEIDDLRQEIADLKAAAQAALQRGKE